MLRFKTEKLQKLDEICRTHGYYLMTVSCFDNGWLPMIRISKLESSGKYMPEIYQDGSSEPLNTFHLQTTSYGALSLAEYKKFRDSCSAAYSLVVALNHYDLSGITADDFYYDDCDNPEMIA